MSQMISSHEDRSTVNNLKTKKMMISSESSATREARIIKRGRGAGPGLRAGHGYYSRRNFHHDLIGALCRQLYHNLAMGNSDSKLVFKQGVLKLSEPKTISPDDTYWTGVYEL